MAQFYFSVNLDSERTLCLAPLSDRLLMSCPEQVSDPSGYFLYELRRRGGLDDIEIIAQVHTDEAALRLSEMMGLS